MELLMQHTTPTRLKGRLRKAVASVLASASLAIASPSYALEHLTCNGPENEFEEQSLLINWDIQDLESNGIEWESTAECGLLNYTGGSGEAKCVHVGGAGSPAFNTTLTTNDFTLKGADSVTLEFDIIYDDFAAGGDRLDIDIRVGGVWTTIIPVVGDVGIPGVSGIHAAIPIAMGLGTEDVKFRFRYHDPTAGLDSGGYVQIDNVKISCTGGADLEATVSPDKPVVLEGEEVVWTYKFKNNGPKAASDVVGFAASPRGFNILGTSISQGVLFPGGAGDSGLAGAIGVIPNGGEVDATLTTRAGIVPEVHLEALSPAAIAGDFEAVGSTFGPEVTPGNPISGLVLLPDDGNGTPDDGCSPFDNASDIAGNIALIRESGACKNDERVKYAQDAGAVAVIVWDDSPALPIPYLSFLMGYATFQPMVPSGNVAVPITIPSLKIRYEAGEALALNIVNSLQVRISGVEVLSQERESFAFTLGEEFDPNFSLVAQTTNNVSSEKVIVLRDSDLDGTANMNESCPFDPAKLQPGACGCGSPDIDSDGDGVLDCIDLCPADASKTAPGSCGCGGAEVDANGNGVIDCQVGPEAKKMLSDLSKLVRKLQKANSKQSANAQKNLRKQINALTSDLFPMLGSSSGFLSLADGSADFAKLSKRAQKAVKKARNTNSPSFAKNKKKALRGLKGLNKQILA